ncbi:MAG: DegV family protein [Desulfobacteraceae bacterium]|nr:MAG: DegV family protein [Desulfobacteraceae bacterium]
MKRLIVTDSTSDLSAELVQGLGVKIIPVNIILDDKTYKDRVEIRIHDFYQNFESYNSMKTAPVSVEEYEHAYNTLAAPSDEIIFIHCSRLLSKTYDHAVKVHKMLQDKHDCKVNVVDSKQCGLGLGLIVIEAARAIKEGRSTEDVLELIDTLSNKIITYMTVPTLKYLRSNQKISGLKSIVANMLNIKPVLGVEGGKIVVKTKLSGKVDNLMLEMVDYIKKDVGDSPVTMGLAHARDTRYLKDLQAIFKNRFECREMFTSYFGPSVGISTGPETMGVTFFKH